MSQDKTTPYETPPEGKGGWTEWVQPTMGGYRMACCDCGLVHTVQFRAIAVVRDNPDGTFGYRELPSPPFRVSLRVRRNERETRRLRKEASDGK